MNRFIFVIPLNSNHDSNDKNELKRSIDKLCDTTQNKCQQKLHQDLFELACTNEHYAKIAFITTNDASKLEWSTFDSLMGEYDAIWEGIWNTDTAKEEEHKQLLADAIHTLADQLPIIGKCFVDVVVHATKSLTKFDDNMQLFGALARLHCWNNAAIFVNCSDSDKEQLSDWKNMLYACEGNVKHGLELWRGCISLGKQASEGPYLQLFNLVATPHKKCNCEATLKIVDTNSAPGIPVSSRRQRIHRNLVTVIGHDLLLVGEYHKLTIPSYILSSTRFTLQLLCIADSTKESQEFLAHMSSSPNMCYLFRLGYEHDVYISKKFSTEEWRDSKSGYGVPRLLEDEKSSSYIHFLVYYEDPEFVAALLFLPENLDLSFFMPNKSADQTSKPSVKDEDITEFLTNLPNITSDLLFTINDLVLEAQEEALNIFEKKYHEMDIEESLKYSAILTLNEMVKDSVIKNLIEENIISAKTELKSSNLPKPLPQLEYERDQNDWPERKALLQQSINSAHEKRHSSLDTLGGMEPPALDSLTISLDAKEFLKNFKQSGEAKKEVEMKSSKLNPIGRKNDGRCPKKSPKSGSSSQVWPETLQHECHGTFFNVDAKSEEDQVRCDKLLARWLSDETSSTCSNTKNKHSEYIRVPKKAGDSSKSSSHDAVRRSPRKHYMSQKISRPIPFNVTGRMKSSYPSLQRTKSDSVAFHKMKSGSSTLQRTYSDNTSVPRRKSTSSTLQRTYSDNSPIPRRKSTSSTLQRANSDSAPVLKSESSSASFQRTASDSGVTVGKKNLPEMKTSQSSLSDIHRMKLRCCVVDELEKYGITLNHPAFKDCGKKLFAICRPFIKDLIGAKSITEEMRKICQSHVKQVIDFEMSKLERQTK